MLRVLRKGKAGSASYTDSPRLYYKDKVVEDEEKGGKARMEFGDYSEKEREPPLVHFWRE